MTRTLTIGSTVIADHTDCYIIAEIGHNHQGKLETAKELFRAAKECGVDAVKLQKRDNRNLFTRELYNSPYAGENSYGDTYGEHREALEFNYEQFDELKNYARELDLAFFATAFDFASADMLAELDVPAFKMASGDLTNTPLLKHVARFGKPMLVSTGGGTFEDVQRAYDTLMPLNSQFCLLQCTANYPVEPEDMHLNVLTTYRQRFPDTVVGLSDHQNGIAMSVVAYALGARIIEKHFTLNRAWRGTDHPFSLEPAGMKKMVRDLRRTRLALGSADKQRLPGEKKPLYKMGKKLVAARDLPVGHTLTRDDVAIKSPNDGLPPYELERVLGKKTLRPMPADYALSFDDLADSNGS